MTNGTVRKSGGEVYELFMLGLCVYVLTILAATSFLPLDPATLEILDVFDYGICVVFMMDFLFKFYSAESKLAYLKWGWIDFLSSIPAIGPLRWGRFARIVRILRLLRGVRSCKVLIEFLLRRRRAESAFGTALLVTLVVVVFSSVAILEFESEDTSANIQSSGDALWWALTTVTSVGYGDHYPITSSGRVLGALTMAAGVALFGTFAGFVASWFLAPQEAEQEDELESIRHRLTSIEGHLQELVLRGRETKLVASLETTLRETRAATEPRRAGPALPDEQLRSTVSPWLHST